MEHRLAKGCLRILKDEFEPYYMSLFSRKACPFIYLALSATFVLAYVFGNTGVLI